VASSGERFFNRESELRALERFWSLPSAQCIPMMGRRRVGKTFLMEHFAASRRHVYHRCQLRGTSDQLALLGEALAAVSDDALVRGQPPTSWSNIFTLIERLTQSERLLLVLDELPYWAARDESVPSVLQNWWDERGRYLNLMLLLCGSAVEMMEHLLTGPAPLAGCITGRMVVRPFRLRSAAEMLQFADPVDTITAYGILGGVPLYLSFFSPELSIRDSLLDTMLAPTSRLYVEPHAVFATHHEAYSAPQALAVLRAIARGAHRWSEIADRSGLASTQVARVMETLIGDLGLVERVLPVTERHETRTYWPQYHLTDNFFRFWFRFVEPNQGAIEFGSAEAVADGIMAELPEYLGLPFEAMCREWVGLASAAGALGERIATVGSWWNANHQIDVVGLDADRQVAVAGECTWRNQGFTWGDLQTYLGHVGALGAVQPVRPDILHFLFSKIGFDERVQQWATSTRARLLTPADLLAPL
jgi:AAA+ ATPase superfamily predicted ATPase